MIAWATTMRVVVVVTMLVACNVGYAESQTCGDVPCVEEWANLTQGSGKFDLMAIASDSAGNTYVSGVGRGTSVGVRLLQKFSREGYTETNPATDGALPWWAGYYSTNDWSQIPWHRIIIDESHGRIYVLFAAIRTSATDVADYYLAVHDINLGQTLRTATYVGQHRLDDTNPSPFKAGGAVDAAGNVWTVIQDTPNSFQVKAWAPDGTPQTLPNGGVIYSPNYREFWAFAIRPTDGLLFLAFRETITGRNPIDLVVTTWTSALQFGARVERNMATSEPADPTSDWWPPNQSNQLHPVFTDGAIDDQGQFWIGGYYTFTRELGCHDLVECFGTYQRFVPVAVRVNDTPAVMATYTESNASISAMHDVTLRPPYPPSVRVAPYGSGKTWLFLRVHFSNQVVALDPTGRRLDALMLDFHEAEAIYSPYPATCDYWSDWYPMDATYTAAGELAVTGPTRMWKAFDQPSTCAASAAVELTNTGLTKSFQRPLPLRAMYKPSWAENLRNFERAWENFSQSWGFPPIDPPWTPRPQPPPCPECRSTVQAPAYLDHLYEAARPFLSRGFGGAPSTREVQNMRERFRDVPEGRFARTARPRLEEALRTPEQSATGILSSLNAVELDWRFGRVGELSIPSGTAHATLNPFVSVSATRVIRGGRLSIVVTDDLPGLPDGFAATWPIAAYTLAFDGAIEASTGFTVRFNVERRMEGMPATQVHVLEWDGSKFTDVTVRSDNAHRLAIGQTKALRTYVLATPLRSAKNRAR